eukprot:gb/GECG01003859.1/.p1 GENE.gb/GECG01003859.1/~~gb/GECG01003859.1/.p1  ORF type:complete len:272 (+),score=32.47 gb/GECG01003859.1/:1-816(+)
MLRLRRMPIPIWYETHQTSLTFLDIIPRPPQWTRVRVCLQARIEGVIEQLERLTRRAEKAVDDAEKGKRDTNTSKTCFDIHQQREELKANYLRFKGSCKEDIDRIHDEDTQREKRTTLRKLQDRYQKSKNDYKVLGILDYVNESEREELFKGVDANANSERKPGQSKNEHLLGRAQDVAQDTTHKLREGLNDVRQTNAQANEVAITLHEDRETISRVTKNLDDIESDLEISQKLLTRFIKRLYTDKIIIAFTCLIVCALAGIIAYKVSEDQ